MNKVLKRVVISGFGMVSPLGIDCSSSWQGLISGEKGIMEIRSIPECQNDSFPTSGYIAAVHKSFDKKKHKIPVIFLPNLGKFIKFLVYA